MSKTLYRSLERVVDGDAEAAGWLYDTFAPGLFHRLTLRYGHLPGVEPSDLLHDAFVFLLRPETKVLRDFLAATSASEFSSKALEKKLWDIACGLASNRRRSAWARRAVTMASIRSASEAGSAEKQAAARDALHKLDQCIEGQTEDGYLYYQLRYVDGLKPREIAAATGRTIKEIYRLRSLLDRVVRLCSERLGLSPK